MLYLETFADSEPFLEQSYNEVGNNRYGHLTLRVFQDFADVLNYYEFVTTTYSGDFAINSFEVADQNHFIEALAQRTRLLYNGFLAVKRCKMEENEFPRTEEILFVTNPSVN